MNTKSFSLGFTVMDSVFNAIESTAHGVQASVQATKNGAVATSDVVTSFFAGAKQAIDYRRGKCRMLAHDVNGNGE